MVTQLGAGTATGQLIRWDGTSWVTWLLKWEMNEL